MNGRIYGEKTSIDMGQVKDFYNRRAGTVKDKVGAVLLGSQNPDILEQKNSFERNYIAPLLNIGQNTRILDLGCGVGRWAEFVLPQCGFYFGIDFSEEMVKIAQKTCSDMFPAESKYKLSCMPLLDAVTKSPDYYGGKFGAVICAGVFMYINDETINQIFHRIPGLLEEQCTIFFTEPVGIKERLTLKEFASDALQASYNAIYRTPEEYVELYEPLLQAGFSIERQKYCPTFGETYTDTGRYFMILKR